MLDSLAEGDVNPWLKQIVQPGERSSVTSPAAPWSRHGTHLENCAACGQVFLAFLTANDTSLVRSKQPWREYLLRLQSPPQTTFLPLRTFWLQCWHFWRSVISSAEEKTETLFKTQLQCGRLAMQILLLHWKHDDCPMLLLFFLF